MPGKVNPVIPEVVNQVAFEVFGNDVTVTFAAEAGQLQLNAFEPIIANALFRSFKHLTNACMLLAGARKGAQVHIWYAGLASPEKHAPPPARRWNGSGRPHPCARS